MGSPEPVDLSVLAQVARNDLKHMLTAVIGIKDLVIEKSLMRQLDLVVNMKMLKEHDVGKIYELDASGSHVGWSDTATNRVYLVRPTVTNTQHICNHWMAERSLQKRDPNQTKGFTIIYVPRKLYICENVLEQNGVFGWCQYYSEVQVEEFNPSLLRLESDVYSLELPELFNSYHVHQDLTWLQTAANAMYHLQSLYGPIHKRYCVGELAKKVHDLIDLQCAHLGQPKPVLSLNDRQPITHMLLFDRAVDWPSVFLTAFTYEALLHETFGISSASMEAKAGQRIALTNQDEVFASVRNKFISAVIPFLSAKAKTLINSADQLKQLGVADLKNFVKSDLKNLAGLHRSLELHIGASEQIIKQRGGRDIRKRIQAEHNLLHSTQVRESLAYVEECLCQQQPEDQCMSLIALASLTQNGLSSRDYEALRRQYLHANGFTHLNLFANLRKMGIITSDLHNYAQIISIILSSSSNRMGSPEPVDLSVLAQVARNDLKHMLTAVIGIKDLVIEKSLMRQLDLVVNMKMLKEHDVGKIYELDASGSHVGWSDTATNRVYLVRPTVTNTQHICNHWMAERSLQKRDPNQTKGFTIIYVPRKLYICENVLEQNGVFGWCQYYSEVQVEEFNPSLLRLESDVYSLELPELFNSYHVHQDLTWLQTAANAMYHLQSLYGPIHKRYCVGELAKKVHDLIDLQCAHLGQPKPVLSLNDRQPITHMLLFDRAVDWPSVFLTAFTYEALLHETFGISSASMEAKAGQRIALTNQDEVFASVRNKFISAVIPFLSAKAKTLINSADQLKQLGVADLKNFVKSDLKNLAGLHRSLELHIGASEQIIKQRGGRDIRKRIQAEHNLLHSTQVRESLAYVEECLCQQQPEDQCMSLIALASLTQNGLSSRDYEALRRQYLHANGFTHLNLFANLRKMGIITEKSTPSSGGTSNRLVSKLTESAAHGASAVTGSSNTADSGANHFQNVVKKLALVPKPDVATKIDMTDPHDMSYVFNGTYTPVVCQLLSRFLQYGFDRQEWSRILQCPVGGTEEVAGVGHTSGQPISFLVYMLGGVTYAEIAAFRLLARIRGVRIVIATSNIIGQRDIMKLIE